MAILESVPDEQARRPEDKLGIPLTHPSEIRNRKSTSKPLIDLGLSPQTQQDVMNHIQASLQEKAPNQASGEALSGDSVDHHGDQEEEEDYGDEEEEYEEEEFDDNVEFVQVKPGEEIKSEQEQFWDEFFDSLVLTVPFTFLYLLLDILVHLQYQHRPTLPELASHLARAAPTLGILVFYTNRYATYPVTTSFLTSASILSGARLIWIVNKAGWSLTTNQAPPMGTLWIFTIVQLPLSRAIIALAGVAGYTYYSGLKIMP